MKKIALSCLVAAFLFSCDTKEEVKRSPKSGGVLNMNLTTKITTLFPPKIIDAVSMTVSSQIFEGLVKVNPQTLDLEPALATKWESNENNTKFTFTLRKNVYFQEANGFKSRLVTVEDVKKCFDYMCQTPNLNEYSVLFCDKILGAKGDGEVEGIKIMNDSTISFELNYPYSDFVGFMTVGSFVVYPPELAEEMAKGNFEKAIGTGPFQVKKINDGEKADLVRNDNYWRKDAEGYPLPYLDGVSFSFLTKDQEVLAFKDKKIDLVKEIPIDQLQNILPSIEEAKAGNNADFNYTSFPGLTIKMISFNFNKEIFQNIDVRKAFNYAINRKKLVDSTLQGDFKPGNGGLIPRLDIFQNTDFEGYAYDAAKAKEHLAKAGYPNGQGFPVLTLQTIKSRVDSVYMQDVVKMLETTLNIKVNFEASKSISELSREIRDNNTFDLWRFGWIADFTSPENFLQLYAKNNASGYKNETFTTLLEQASREQDEETRLKTYIKADRVLMDDAALIPLLYSDIEFLAAKKVTNFYSNPIDYRDFREVYLSK